MLRNAVDAALTPGGSGGVDLSQIPDAAGIDAQRQAMNQAGDQLDLVDPPETPPAKKKAGSGKSGAATKSGASTKSGAGKKSGTGKKKAPGKAKGGSNPNDPLGGVLSPAEIVLAGAYSRFLARRPDIAATAKVDVALHDTSVVQHVILDQANAGANSIAGVAGGAVRIVRAALTDRTDAVEIYVENQLNDPNVAYQVRESLKVAFGPVDTVYDRAAGLQAGRNSTANRRQNVFAQNVTAQQTSQQAITESQRLKAAPLPEAPTVAAKAHHRLSASKPGKK
jgi:hypothetical protein